VTVYATIHVSSHRAANLIVSYASVLMNSGMTCLRKFTKKLAHFLLHWRLALHDGVLWAGVDVEQ
jgi:hypothetical protein